MAIPRRQRERPEPGFQMRESAARAALVGCSAGLGPELVSMGAAVSESAELRCGGVAGPS